MMYAPLRRHRRRRGRAPTALGFSGGVALLGGGYVGLFLARSIHAWAVTYAAGATNAPALPAGVPDQTTYNQLAILARPNWQSQVAQWSFSLGTFLLGMVMPWRIGKLISYGISGATALHAGGQLINGWIVLPLLQSTTWGQRAYGAELQANYSLGKMTQPTQTTATTTQGLGQPPQVGGRRGAGPAIRTLPQTQPARVPQALATGRASPFPNGTPAALGQPAVIPGYVGSGDNGPPAVTVPNLPSGNCPDGTTTVVNPTNLDLPYCVPQGGGTPPPPNVPPPNVPPPAVPPPAVPPPVVTTTPTPPPATNCPPPGAPACPIPWPGAPQPCCNTSPCSCSTLTGAGSVPGTVLGQPQGDYVHPLIGMMVQPPTARRAA